MTRHQDASATEEPIDHRGTEHLMEEVATEENLRRAYQRVRRNGGAPGPDGQTVEALGEDLEENLVMLREGLRAGRYRPGPVRGVEIPKPGGGHRQLGIPNVQDRLVQQAMLQALTPIFDPEFSESSFGFRPGRSPHDALLQARQYVRSGLTWVVNLDLHQFFDTVQHDLLMARVAKKVRDKRILKLIGRFLRAGLMKGGMTSPRFQGTPQGGPLSPLLSNILLDDLDKRLEATGHAFVRYADDFLIFKRTERAAWRTKGVVTRFLHRSLRLEINETKSSVDRPETLAYLGYTFTERAGSYQLAVAPKSLKRLRERLRPELTRWGRGRPIERTIEAVSRILRGWFHYFKLARSQRTLEQQDTWIRRHLRCLQWRQWGRSAKRRRELRARGLTRYNALVAGTRKGPWRVSKTPSMHQAMPNAYFEDLDLFSLRKAYREHWQRT